MHNECINPHDEKGQDLHLLCSSSHSGLDLTEEETGVLRASGPRQALAGGTGKARLDTKSRRVVKFFQCGLLLLSWEGTEDKH